MTVPGAATVRTLWRRLTSMRTALILLFLLAVAAVPGSLLPQRPLNPSKVTTYIRQHGAWGRFLDDVGAYDVFGSPWFAAIYLLLFISLVGCLVPRIRVHAKALARAPLPAPRQLTKLPESGSFAASADPASYAATARATLGRRWRVTEREEAGGVVTLSAEKGYSRETGNLIFHVALLAALLLIAVGRLYSYEGTAIVQQGQGFCNNAGNYDSYKPGRLAASGDISPAPFCIDAITKFDATYGANGEPRDFAAHLTYSPSVTSSDTKDATIKVNHPLRLQGDRVYLTGHGFAPTVTVHMPDGRTLTRTANFLPSNATTLYSEGVYNDLVGQGSGQDVGISAFFAPSPVKNADGTIGSASPKTQDPVLGVFVYLGQLDRSGQTSSVYDLNMTTKKQIGPPTDLVQGQTKSFGHGVTVTFDGWTPWVNLQVSHDPAQGWLLLAALAMVLGLALSLGVRRRRLWLRIGPADGATTLVRVGGLARSDSGNFTGEFQTLLTRLQAAGTTDEPADSGITRDAVGAGKD